MRPAPQGAPASKKALWAGRIISGLAAAMMLFSGVLKLAQPASVLEEFARLGYPESLVLGIGIVEILCTIVYLVPRTSVLGAILLAAYLGGATATHVRIGDPFVGPILIGVAVWAGLFLREGRLRQLIPLRR